VQQPRTARDSDRPALGEMLEDVLDLSGGAVVVLLPLFMLSVPGFALFGYVVPLAAVAALVAIAGAILAAPFLLVRAVRRRARAARRPLVMEMEGGVAPP
jgi:Flp pilus assembly protein TadB